MDIPRLRYSRHARQRIEHYHVSEDEVEAVVVTNRAERFVFTITDEDRRKGDRRKKERRHNERRRRR